MKPEPPPLISVFIVDDHQIVIDGLKSLLSEPPFFLAGEATDGQQAFNKLQADPYLTEILLTDISMPGIDGIQLCSLVKIHFPFIRVLILSMYSSEPLLKEAIRAEADGFILKTAGKKELHEALTRVYHGGTYYSEGLIPILHNLLRKDRPAVPSPILTERETEILRLIVQEFTSEQIAEMLQISKRTVDNHRFNIHQKTGIRTTVGLVKFAMQQGIVPP